MFPQKILNPWGQRLDFACHEAVSPSGKLLLIGHGVTANKDREWALALAERVVAAGWSALRFSFSGNGESEGRFEDSCPTRECADLGAVLDALDAAVEGSRKPWQLAYAGHSMGAAVGVMRASEDPRIQFLISLGGMVHTADFAQRKFGELRPDADFMWDKPECPLSQHFLDDMHAVGSVEHLAPSIEVPWLLVHGGADPVVPAQESEQIALRAGGQTDVVLLAGADHVFSGADSALMADQVAQWLGGH